MYYAVKNCSQMETEISNQADELITTKLEHFAKSKGVSKKTGNLIKILKPGTINVNRESPHSGKCSPVLFILPLQKIFSFL